MYLTEQLQEKWAKVLDHKDLPAIRDAHKRAVLTVLLENQEKELIESKAGGLLTEAVPANAAQGFPNNNANLKGYDPVLISLLRRALPNLMAFDVCGVQPMKASTGMIFALKSRYTSQGGNEALHFEADSFFSGTGITGGGPQNTLDPFSPNNYGEGISTADGEGLGTGAPEPEFPEMAFSIDKVVVEAKTRALKAEYTMEIAQDLKAVHGLDAETELANILSAEILAEINREVIRVIYNNAVPGAQQDVAVAGQFNLDVDSNGRWSVEKYKGLMVQLEREANAIAKQTRRGRGNFIICDSDTASALSVAGLLDCNSALKDSLNVDDTANNFVGVLNGRFKVFIDPYAPLTLNFAVVGFKGANQYDAGLFYCPYVPLQMLRAVGENSFQPKIGFKTRYGIVTNPFGNLAGNSNGSLVANANVYYRKTRILNLL
jgi:hypothetical protein